MEKKSYRTVFEVSVEKARKWIRAWIDSHGKGAVKGFLIDADELRAIIDESGAKYVRIYLGVNKALPQDRHKLLLVPVDEEGCDMCSRKKEASPTEAEEDSNVFDFTMPCPPTCDAVSPLHS
ncbi:MAG: hypothetical protein JST68_30815 [Bacteroidetes bacterium]|nr:hypothetical protein [Bacteroidota bacterium]